MTSTEFCYWLQGLLELGDVKTLDERQVDIVRQHLGIVFTKVTPAPAPALAQSLNRPPVDTLIC